MKHHFWLLNLLIAQSAWSFCKFDKIIEKNWKNSEQSGHYAAPCPKNPKELCLKLRFRSPGGARLYHGASLVLQENGDVKSISPLTEKSEIPQMPDGTQVPLTLNAWASGTSYPQQEGLALSNDDIERIRVNFFNFKDRGILGRSRSLRTYTYGDGKHHNVVSWEREPLPADKKFKYAQGSQAGFNEREAAMDRQPWRPFVTPGNLSLAVSSLFKLYGGRPSAGATILVASQIIDEIRDAYGCERAKVFQAVDDESDLPVNRISQPGTHNGARQGLENRENEKTRRAE